MHFNQGRGESPVFRATLNTKEQMLLDGAHGVGERAICQDTLGIFGHVLKAFVTVSFFLVGDAQKLGQVGYLSIGEFHFGTILLVKKPALAIQDVRQSRFVLQLNLGCQFLGEREVDFRARDMVEVISEDIQRRMSDEFDNITIGEAVGAKTCHVGIGDEATFLDDLAHKAERGGGLGVRGGSATGIQDALRVQAGHAAEDGMRGHTILARVGFTDGQRDAFAELGGKGTVG